MNHTSRFIEAPLLLGSIFLLMLTTLLPASELQCRVEVSQSEPYWVGQRVTVRLFVLAEEETRSNPIIGPLHLSGGIALQRPGSLSYHSETDPNSGRRLQGRIVFIECFPQQTGKITLAPIMVRQVIQDQESTAHTSALNFNSQSPPGSEGFGTFITSTKLQVQQHWSSLPSEALPGSSIERHVSWQADNFLGMALPLLPTTGGNGLRVYAGDSVPSDRSNRGTLVGSRQDTLTYLFEQPGTYDLPTLTIPWYNITAQRMENITLPGQQIHIKSPPPAAKPSTTAGHWSLVWAALAVVIGAGALGALWLTRQTKPETEMARRQLLQALRQQDAEASHRALLHWLTLLPTEEATRERQRLAKMITTLSAYRFGTGPTPAWPQLQQAIRFQSNQEAKMPSLQELNPHE